jgi:myo-inositol 2-dehydrogenase / D-chiro-inositol 1-dehydrogenase
MGEEGGFDFVSGALTFRDRARSRQMIQPGPQADSRMALEAFLTSIRSDKALIPPISLADARAATEIGLLVRKAVDLERVVGLDEIEG